ncbi:MAG: bifunctional 5,10-methylenetetrahydrofolate dehydrogenase/5,10-methenyltetrahydrofolate cyclohydrolase [Candidatus Nomurabacteria bacterium]|jgi:methylenetetrahydrofolate dehydrogenase (NADP+)/methenyltetrahydrofolate cyclohydrolase|nr:bifunctional 5,10-methylenetetrahydrofolate dehydrogenase/5,10-methenyltetrahydrofolate cyclohydrolase [Candidatus Nomurabacteria bacterium]
MKELDGAELVDFIKERQAHQVRGLRQTHGIVPKLLILRDSDNPVIERYVGLKKRYGEEIGVEVEDEVLQGHFLQERSLQDRIEQANDDDSIHGIIVQLPLQERSLQKVDEVLSKIAPAKDVDGLAAFARTELAKSGFISATATAIDWLLSGYNIDLRGKRIAIVGQGRLVGAPLTKLWQDEYDVRGFDISDADDLAGELTRYDLVVSATGVPGLLKPNMIKEGAVVVDAGTASEGGVLKGDASDELRARRDITITPKIGGVGPLTVAVLFDHVIRAAIDKTKKV